MSQAKESVPAVEGWFRAEDDGPHLIGTRCAVCGCIFFPREERACRNPSCTGADLEEVSLSRTGTLWSFTDNRYQPPPPYVSPDPFVPYAVAAVELAAEKMVVLGQVAAGFGSADLRVGMDMELVLEPLFADEEKETVAWKWKPVAGAAS